MLPPRDSAATSSRVWPARKRRTSKIGADPEIGGVASLFGDATAIRRFTESVKEMCRHLRLSCRYAPKRHHSSSPPRLPRRRRCDQCREVTVDRASCILDGEQKIRDTVDQIIVRLLVEPQFAQGGTCTPTVPALNAMINAIANRFSR